eukprot:m.112048 g.112048  ORF g.112048 m.112048 type:complete len:135 (+) comp9245_c0_seq1:1906-2310(+)
MRCYLMTIHRTKAKFEHTYNMFIACTVVCLFVFVLLTRRTTTTPTNFQYIIIFIRIYLFGCCYERTVGVLTFTHHIHNHCAYNFATKFDGGGSFDTNDTYNTFCECLLLYDYYYYVFCLGWYFFFFNFLNRVCI